MATTMEQQIEIVKNGRQPQEITELVLDSIEASQVAGIDDTYCNMKTLGLAAVGLESLAGFPKLENLDKLDLSGNKLNGGFNHLQGCTQLSHLDVSSNMISSLDAFEPLKILTNLTHISMANNPLCEADADHKIKISKLLPSLTHLNGVVISESVDKENSAPAAQVEDVQEDTNEVTDADKVDNGSDVEEGAEEVPKKERKVLGLSAIYDDNLGDVDDAEDYDEDDELTDESEDDDLDDEDVSDEDVEDEEEDVQPDCKKSKVSD